MSWQLKGVRNFQFMKIAEFEAPLVDALPVVFVKTCDELGVLWDLHEDLAELFLGFGVFGEVALFAKEGE